MTDQPILWPNGPEIEPCFRMNFRLLLSQNRLAGEKWEKTNEIELWRGRGEARLVKTAKELNIPTEGYVEEKHYSYQGKRKVKIMAGERMKRFLFTEPIILICRVWTSSEQEIDIDNIHLKAVIDGFVDGRLIPDDKTKYLRGVFRWFEGIDRSVSLSPEESDERRRIRNQYKIAGVKRTLPPPANKKFLIDIYRLSRLIENKIDFFSLIGFSTLDILGKND